MTQTVKKIFENDFAHYVVLENCGLDKTKSYSIFRRSKEKKPQLQLVGPLDKYSKAKAFKMARYWAIVDGKRETPVGVSKELSQLIRKAVQEFTNGEI